jgi:hypothetical protein
MARTVDRVQRVSTGIEVRGDILHRAPENDATDCGTHRDLAGDAP